MTCDEAHHIPKELLEISNLCKQKFGEHVWKWILRVEDIDGKEQPQEGWLRQEEG